MLFQVSQRIWPRRRKAVLTPAGSRRRIRVSPSRLWPVDDDFSSIFGDDSAALRKTSVVNRFQNRGRDKRYV